MDRRTGAVAVAVACLAVTAGCGEEASEAADPDATASVEAGSSTSAEESEGAAVRIELVDAGSRPRAGFRLSLDEGDSQQATMVMTTEVVQAADGQQRRTVTPPIEMGMTLSVTDLADNGDLTATYAYDDVRVRGKGQVADQMRESLRGFDEIEGWSTLTPTGEHVDGAIDVPDGIDPMTAGLLDNLGSQMEQIVVPLPQEEIGPGARWTVETGVDSGGIEITTAAEYTLVERRGSALVIDVALTQTGDPQDAAPGVHVDSLDGSGTGRVVIDPHRLAPRSSRSETESSMVMTVEDGDRSTRLEQTTSMTMELRGR